MIIAVVNQKGGVGKTTTVVNVASYFSAAKHDVLIVDLDPQGNATSGLGIEKNADTASTYDLLAGTHNIASVALNTHVAQLHIIPSDPNLAGAEVELVARQGREFVLGSSLAHSNYDPIFIDCPPSLGLLTVNALSAAEYVLIPVQAEFYALEGLSQLLRTIQAIKQTTNPRLEILGIVLTMYDKRNSLSEQVRIEVEKYFGDKLFKTTIPRNVRLAEAPSYGRTIYEHDRWSKGSRAYKALSLEIMQRL